MVLLEFNCESPAIIVDRLCGCYLMWLLICLLIYSEIRSDQIGRAYLICSIIQLSISPKGVWMKQQLQCVFGLYLEKI